MNRAPEDGMAYDKPERELGSGGCIWSPMVGTVHLAPSAGAAPFIQPGDVVGIHTVVCIIEAMQVMCEFKAETSGTITKVLVRDGDSIDYGQSLFEIR